jgi:hypothetical protein
MAITVSSSADSGAGTLRQAIEDAVPGDSQITFDASLDGASIVLSSGPLVIAKDLTIDALGVSSLTVSGNHAVRVFEISGSDTDVELRGLTIADGLGAPNGGGIYIEQAALRMEACRIRGNRACDGEAGMDGGIGISLVESGPGTVGGDGGGIFASGADLALSRCLLDGNSSGQGGGGGEGYYGFPCCGDGGDGGASGNGGGLYLLDSDCILELCTVAENILPDGGGGGGGGSGGQSPSDPGSGGDGGVGGEGGSGAGIYSSNSSLVMRSCTVTRNGVGRGGSGGSGGSPAFSGGLFGSDGDSGEPGLGSGIYHSMGSISANNSVVAGNFLSDLEGASLDADNLTGSDPRLGPLADFGGRTPTVVPYPNSPVIDMGSATLLTTDQRGFPRTVGAQNDFGAVEFDPGTDLEALLQVLTEDPDLDGITTMVEMAVGTDPDRADRDSQKVPRVAIGRGAPGITFGYAAEHQSVLIWIVKRSTDLVNFTEVYRIEGGLETRDPSVQSDFEFGLPTVAVTEFGAAAERVFYRFEVALAMP